MARYRKKPVVIEAVQWTGENFDEIKKFCPNLAYHGTVGGLIIETLEGGMRARVDDFIIQGVKGEFYPCKLDIFEATYEVVE
ncbi:MAG: hypothetical protein E4H40_07410 [Candidatus Brocadiia bacterium]|nr:MAG: hypothetical protein E4H40_07410 [Candidatus Brocadiia bacterium]